MSEEIDKLIAEIGKAAEEERVSLGRQLRVLLRDADGKTVARVMLDLLDSVREAGLKEAEKRSDPEVLAAVQELAASDESRVRVRVANLLGCWAAGALDEVLEKLLGDNEDYVRIAAVQASGARGQFMERLRQALTQDGSWEVRRHIAQVLGTRPADESAALLFRALACDDDDDVQRDSALALNAYFDGKGCPEALADIPTQELFGAWKILRVVRPEVVPQLRQWLEQQVAKSIDTKKIAEFGADLTELAAQGSLPRAYQVNDVCEAVTQILEGTGNRSMVLLGNSGCGKTAIVQELTHRLRQHPDGEWRVIRVSPSDLLVGTKYLGEWETRVRELLEAVRAPRRVLLHIPNLDELSSVGRSSNSESNVATFLAPSIEDGSVTILGECTPEGYERGLGRIGSLRRLFQQVLVADGTQEQTRAVLDSIREETGTQTPDTVHDRLLELAVFYNPGTSLPGPAVDLYRAILEKRAEADGPATESDLLETLSGTTGIPERLLDDSQALELGEVRSFFEARVMGQTEGVNAMVDMVTLVKAGLTDPAKPLGVLLFVGPTGVGKTELARALAEFIFGDASRLLRLDMSEYASFEGFERLIGAGTTPGTLTSAVRERPFSVVLLDEIEKAHMNVFDLCLQIFDAGRLTDSLGRTVDFRRTIVILTSNVGAASPNDERVGFLAPSAENQDPQHVLRELTRFFRPEFLNRIDRVITFRPLTREVAERIARREITRVLQRGGIQRRGITVDVDPAVLSILLRRGYSTHFGARPLKRAVEQLILLPLGRSIATGKLADGAVLRLVPTGERVGVQVVSSGDEGVDEPPRAPEEERLVTQLEAVQAQLDTLRRELGPLEERKSGLLDESSREGFWSQQDHARKVMSEVHRIDEVVNALKGIESASEYVARRVERGVPESEDRDSLSERLEGLSSECDQLMFLLHCDDVEGLGDAIVSITQVGQEEGNLDALRKLAEMYQALARRRHLTCEVLAECEQRESQEESLVLLLEGLGSYALLKGEAGIHKMVRKTRSVVGGSERHHHERSLVRVEVLPAPTSSTFTASDVQVVVKSRKPRKGKLLERADLEIALFHKPTFTSVRAWTRGPHPEAIGRMELVLQARVQANEARSPDGEAPLVRRYHVGATPRVKDYRSGKTTSRIDRVLDGHLDSFLLLGESGGSSVPLGGAPE